MRYSFEDSSATGQHRRPVWAAPTGPVAVAIIDGPYDAGALSDVLASAPSGSDGRCRSGPNDACDHGTFVMGLLGARADAPIPGLCPGCALIHIPLFVDAVSPSARVDDLAAAIEGAVAAGARVINLSLAILGGDSQINPRLAAALEAAEASGAVLLVAAGNQGRRVTGQLLSHPAVIPVVAADAAQILLPDSNFGPEITRRGVAALGRMAGYAPDGGTTVMSGTSVAAAVATGILAQLWSERPDIDADTLRSAVAALGPRDGAKPPMLDRNRVLAELDRMVGADGEARTNDTRLQGAMTMTTGNGRSPTSAVGGLLSRSMQIVRPAGGDCGCGAPDGACSCGGHHDTLSGFVYAIGTIEADYPNIAIEREMQLIANHLSVGAEIERDGSTKLTEDRNWQHAVLSKDRKLTRYIARQLRWRLTIEDFPVFLLNPNDPGYFDDLIDALARPKYPAKAESRRGKSAAKQAIPIAEHAGLAEDLDVVVGVVGPRTPDGIVISLDQIFQVDRNQLIPDGLKYFPQIADSHGLTDEDRAYNFLFARYRPPLGEIDDYKFMGMRIVPSRLGSDTGRIVRAIYTFRNPAAGEREFFVRVDVTHEFPMIVSPWQPYLERGGRL
ncbi:Subtilase family protein [Tardiphaga sp. OK245]|nr:Subtilase family protein [Tardiphaga sp. OK245]